ncbi:GTPase Era [Butyrivibrio sp. YAB3001]|uniref:GTPase Era n=1 Tax=Butyrivibrio sp. YAB3001 TaxID=1520812 RepID=UPI0008F658F0|nr:GTPase Era [Butyrivibrio sp. YAB3001]SFB69218.1 GTP-binding protein Era [Butyrivibrio sp. YAB3001]
MDNNFKTGFITLIGRPNVGKSTLMNQMIGQKIAITSNKPQTTRNRIMTVYTDEECQMIFLDTPGIHETKNKLGEYMTKVAKSTLEEVDVVLWLVEPSTFIGAGEKMIIEELKKCKKPVILVINKIDTVSADKLETFENAYRQEMDFDRVVHVAALKRQNIDGVMKAIKDFLPFGQPFYDEETLTDQPERQIAAEIIREKALRLLQDEVPHGIAVTIETMRMREKKVEPEKPKKKRHQHPPKKSKLQQAEIQNEVEDIEETDGPLVFNMDSMNQEDEYYDPDGIMDIDATIICERDSHKGIVIGKNGAMLKKIGSTARKDIENLVGCKVNLQLWVKVRKDWRDDKTQMKSFGYDIKDLNR